jgi:putative transposase
MTFVPRYNYPVGTEVTLHRQKMALSSTTDEGYELVDLETGQIGVISFSKMVELVKSPAMMIASSSCLTTGIVELRLGDLKAAEQLAVSQQEYGEFHHAICSAIAALRTKLRCERNDPNLRLTEPLLNDVENRKFICGIAGTILGKKVKATSAKGGKNGEWILYAGRTLLKYLAIYDAVGPDDDVIAALATRDHLKGNRTHKIPYKLLDLMTKAWEEVGLDLKVPAPSNVHNYLETLVHEENQLRKRNGLAPLITPSQRTLTAHLSFLLNPTEYLVATKGERHGRNKRGRGSTDIRALFPGELVEADECKLSLVSSSKERGYWERLSSNDQKALEEIDAEISTRLTLLVMIDVATRMPLAWIVSDQPKATATLALLRMATRDKAKEKAKYGCEGDPAPPMGLGMVKTDNGVGLRAKPVIQSLLGTTAAYTAVRTYASPDKPYVERLIGTTESALVKLIHGYTGRKAGELPGYDSKANGVLDVDELYGILTRFFIDEYPSMRHMGVGMGGRRPAEVIKELNKTRGLFKLMDEDQRRIHLGWKLEVTPNDEGVRVFSGIWFNSPEFQIAIDNKAVTKVSVFVDPENVNEATAIIPRVAGEFRLQLQVTAFADMTIPEVLELTEAHRREHPDVTEIHEDRIASTRRKRFDQLRRIGVENKLPRSYSTFDECRTKARHVFGGARIVRSSENFRTVQPGEISSSNNGPGVFSIGDGGAVIDHQDDDLAAVSIERETAIAEDEVSIDVVQKPEPVVRPITKLHEQRSLPIGRPKTKGTFK